MKLLQFNAVIEHANGEFEKKVLIATGIRTAKAQLPEGTEIVKIKQVDVDVNSVLTNLLTDVTTTDNMDFVRGVVNYLNS